MARAVGFIPARYASSRFPGKPLAPLDGKPLIRHVWERAARARRLERVVVATDDDRIAQAARGFGAEAILTSPHHRSGTDRVIEALARLEEREGRIEIVLNVQGDEPLLDPASLDALVAALEDDSSAGCATLAEPFAGAREVLDPNTCKVVTDAAGDALYFSRSPVPFLRRDGPGGIEPVGSALAGRPEAAAAYLRHVGIYAFRREALLEFGRAPAGRLESMEGLEQLRILEAGRKIRVVTSREVTMDVDTPEDLEAVRALMAGRPRA
jgi:3-deoxy-manno-octulosonate cytidylyltransferase (CMP-KDO synthetase)